jgi:hypothetical protein
MVSEARKKRRWNWEERVMIGLTLTGRKDRQFSGFESSQTASGYVGKTAKSLGNELGKALGSGVSHK